MSVDIVEANEFDFDEFHALLKHAFQGRDSSNPSLSVPSAGELSHKYKNSSYPSKIAAVKISGKLVAVNGLLPIEINSPSKHEDKTLSWMSCDTATHVDFRGQGLFKKCVLELERNIPNNSLFFGFPNSNSMPGFQKLGWEIFREYKLWVKPSFISIKKIAEIKEISISDISDYDKSIIGIRKGSQYLNWRYYSDNDIYRAFNIFLKDGFFSVITRVMTINKIKFTLILEVINHEDLLSTNMLRSLTVLARKLKTSGVLITNNELDQSRLIGSGFIKVPNNLISRRIYLSGKILGESGNSELNPKNWKINLGDFDAL